MDFNEFIEKIIEIIKEKFEDEIEIRSIEVMKNNGVKLKGITIKKQKGSIAPTIYMETYYEEYKKGQEIEEIADRLMQVYFSNELDDSFDVDYYQDFNKIKSKLFCKAISIKKNKELLETIPYEEYYDLAIVVYCRVDEIKAEKASILVKNTHLNMWNIDVKELLNIAKENTRNNIGIEIVPICEAINRQFDNTNNDFSQLEPDLPMYVVTSTDYIFGAVFMCFEEHLKSLAERLGDDFYILPSSIHEIIILRANSDNNLDELGSMVKEVNSSFLDATEILSDHAYLYSREQEVLIF